MTIGLREDTRPCITSRCAAYKLSQISSFNALITDVSLARNLACSLTCVRSGDGVDFIVVGCQKAQLLQQDPQ
jgi:hypothetical protein